MSVFLYSQHPLEQAVFEQFIEISKDVEKLLLQQPENVVTTPIGGFGYFMAGGTMLTSPEVGFDSSPISDEELFFARKPIDIEGMAYGDIFGIIQSTKEWLKEPSFITLDRPINPLTDDQIKHVQTPDFSGKDLRIGAKIQPQYRPYYRETVPVTVTDTGRFGIASAEIDGTSISFQLNEASLALITGSSLVRQIHMVLPMLSEFGKPSAFSILSDEELTAHLCYGTSFSPKANSCATSVQINEGPQHRMEYVLDLPTYLIKRAQALSSC